LENSATLPANVVGPQRSGQIRRLRGAIRPWLVPKVVAGGVIVLILIIVGLLAHWIAPYDPNVQNLSHALRPPDWLFGSHLLGTDAVGRAFCRDCSMARACLW
jgi:ABC-type dipeptide/oligopeptide/nickel transport system permease subunit